VTLFAHQSPRPLVRAFIKQALREYGLIRALGSCTLLPAVIAVFGLAALAFGGHGQ